MGGANLHTLLGVRYPKVTLEHFLQKKVKRLEDTIIPTAFDGLGLICGADDILGSANPTHFQKHRLLREIEDLPTDFVILDLGTQELLVVLGIGQLGQQFSVFLFNPGVQPAKLKPICSSLL